MKNIVLGIILSCILVGPNFVYCMTNQSGTNNPAYRPKTRAEVASDLATDWQKNCAEWNKCTQKYGFLRGLWFAGKFFLSGPLGVLIASYFVHYVNPGARENFAGILRKEIPFKGSTIRHIMGVSLAFGFCLSVVQTGRLYLNGNRVSSLKRDRAHFGAELEEEGKRGNQGIVNGTHPYGRVNDRMQKQAEVLWLTRAPGFLSGVVAATGCLGAAALYYFRTKA